MIIGSLSVRCGIRAERLRTAIGTHLHLHAAACRRLRATLEVLRFGTSVAPRLTAYACLSSSACLSAWRCRLTAFSLFIRTPAAEALLPRCLPATISPAYALHYWATTSTCAACLAQEDNTRCVRWNRHALSPPRAAPRAFLTRACHRLDARSCYLCAISRALLRYSPALLAPFARLPAGANLKPSLCARITSSCSLLVTIILDTLPRCICLL